MYRPKVNHHQHYDGKFENYYSIKRKILVVENENIFITTTTTTTTVNYLSDHPYQLKTMMMMILMMKTIEYRINKINKQLSK